VERETRQKHEYSQKNASITQYLVELKAKYFQKQIKLNLPAEKSESFNEKHKEDGQLAPIYCLQQLLSVETYSFISNFLNNPWNQAIIEHLKYSLMSKSINLEEIDKVLALLAFITKAFVLQPESTGEKRTGAGRCPTQVRTLVYLTSSASPFKFKTSTMR